MEYSEQDILFKFNQTEWNYVVHFDKEDDDEGFTIYPSFNGFRIRIYF